MEIVRKQSVAWRQIRDEFLEAQGGDCPICGLPPEKPCLDHCHQDGFIRGTLCGPCNVMLGWYEAKRPAIETYLAKAAEFQAYQLAPSRKRAHPRGAPEWVRRYWLHKAEPDARLKAPEPAQVSL